MLDQVEKVETSHTEDLTTNLGIGPRTLSLWGDTGYYTPMNIEYVDMKGIWFLNYPLSDTSFPSLL